jgi:glycosyltransferase involved in cell wall biosynthesis
MTILFLYSAISTYTEACLRAAAGKVEIHVVKYPVTSEAPFQFSKIENCTYYNRTQYNAEKLLNLCKTIQPDILIVCGWMDNDYLYVAKSFRKKIPVVLTMDNYWLGTTKQRFLCLISPFFLKRIFSHIWVPGKPQVEYAKKLKFEDHQIRTKFYSANVHLYNQFYDSFKEEKIANFPKRFLYVGRYVAFKNMQLMNEAFIEAVEEKQSNWELWCIGTGELWNNRIEHPQIRHIGFVQPDDMSGYVEQTGIFVLPSTVENWGVVVHEFAAAGFPLICSTGVGATSEFLQESQNGFTFDPYKKANLKDIFVRIMNMRPEELNCMGKISHELAQKITPEIWADTVLTFN